jgi:hypothetical protein
MELCASRDNPLFWGGIKLKMHFVILLLVLSPLCAAADQFQIVEKKAGNLYNVSYATVRISNPRFEGSTDGFGRLTIDLPVGLYTAQVNSPERNGHVTIRIDHTQNLKVVNLE